MKTRLLTITTQFFAVAAFTTPLGIRRTFSLGQAKDLNIDKDVYRHDKVQGEFDTIVIGSGIGGLTTACILARQGQKVCVLEQHYVAGGAMHTPPNDPVVWEKMNNNFETAVFGHPSCRHEIVVGEEKQKKKLIERFPDEEKAIEKYYTFVKKARRSLSRATMLKALPLPLARALTWTGLHRLIDGGFHRWSQHTVQEVLQTLTTNKELQALLAYNWGDYGVVPDRAPFFVQAYVATHFENGGYYPNGGPSEIAKRLIKSINNYGGKVLVSAPVKSIILDEKNGNAVGVEMVDGEKIKAKTVVSDAGVINTATKLLPPDTINIEFAKDIRATYGKLHPSMSALNLFVGLKGDYKSLGLPESQYWIYPSNDLSAATRKLAEMTIDEALKMNPKDLSPIFVGIPATKDKTWAEEQPGKTGLEIITFTPFHWFEEYAAFDKKGRSHGAEYESVKLQLGEKIWERVVEVLGASGARLPEKLDDVDHFEIGTPLSFAHYYQAEKGSLYGIDMDMDRFQPKNFFLRLRPEVPEVPSLFMTGQDITGDGFANAMGGGLLCAQKVLGVANPMSLVHQDDQSKFRSENTPFASLGLLDAALRKHLTFTKPWHN